MNASTPPPERKLKTKIPALIAARGLDLQQFTAKCFAAGIQSVNTVKRLFNGEQPDSLATFAKAANALELSSIADVVDFDVEIELELA